MREQRVEAQRTVEALHAALIKDGEALLSVQERARIDKALAELELRLDDEDEKTLKAAMENLDRTCGFYVERRMNRSIQSAMAGHKVEEFQS